jgi:hypothetical protein
VTSPESPSALLERAAALIEQRAAVATAGVWEADRNIVLARVADVPKPPPHPGIRQRPARPDDFVPVVTNGYEEGGCERPEDAAWIATMQPSAASPLVEWLRAESEYIRGIRSWKHLPDNTRHAVAFARIVLGEPE